MLDNLKLLDLPSFLVTHLDYAYTLFLLVARFGGLFTVLPGLQGGLRGLTVRTPFFIALSLASLSTTPAVPVPSNIALLIVTLITEILLGMALGLIPLIIVAAAQNAGQLSSISMGLQTSAQLDPTTGSQTADMAKLFGDLTTLSFLLMNGHHVIIYAASGLSGKIIPGSFIVGEHTISLLIDRSADIFSTGIILASPVIVALFLTQFVLGFVSKMVPQFNAFIVSFPLTIGIGMILCSLTLPEFVRVVSNNLVSLESFSSIILSGASSN